MLRASKKPLLRWEWFLLPFLMIGCIRGEVVPTQTIPPAQPPATQTAAPGPTNSPIPAPTLTPVSTLTATPASPVVQDCFAVINSFPPGTAYQGVAALYDPGRFTYELFDFQTGEKKELVGKIYHRLVVSPNQKYFAYHSESANQLRVVSTAGKLIHLWAWEKDWGYVGYLWDDGRVLVKLARVDPNNPNWTIYPSTLVIVDPSSGKRKILLPAFPDINQATYIDWHGFGATLYDPTLTRVVYPSNGDGSVNGNPFTLWDVPGGRMVTKDLVGWIGEPVWSNDGSKFLFFQYSGEFFLMSRDGASTQVTHLNQPGAERNYRSTSYSLSPDGNQAALWLEGPGDPNDANLALLDLKSGKVTDLCVRGSGEPVWSPDGKALLIEAGGQQGESETLLVDLEKKLAMKIASSRRPDGWLDPMD